MSPAVIAMRSTFSWARALVLPRAPKVAARARPRRADREDGSGVGDITGYLVEGWKDGSGEASGMPERNVKIDVRFICRVIGMYMRYGMCVLLAICCPVSCLMNRDDKPLKCPESMPHGCGNH
jgi:hypothetical protein